ncbi:MAG: hypothetical protein IE878_03900 [Epsilonproteobacteria bacterium]|nr:hypothetical protein [Campylobacterota bacterium]
MEEKKKTTLSPELNKTIVQDSNRTFNTIENNTTNTTTITTSNAVALEENTTIESNLTDTSSEINETQVDSNEGNTTALIPIETLTLVPSEKIWFRLTNQKSRRYKTYANQTQEYSFDLSTDWLMIVKKGSFTFIDNHTQKEYNVTTLSYFKIDKVSGVTQLSQEEYKKLGGYGL